MPEKKMVTYHLIKELEKKGLYKECLKSGLISATLEFKKYVYEYFQKEKETHKTAQAVTNTSLDCGCNEIYVYRAIKKMEE